MIDAQTEANIYCHNMIFIYMQYTATDCLCLPTVCLPFHPVLICEKQCQACDASCLVEILYLQHLKDLMNERLVQNEIIHARKMILF